LIFGETGKLSPTESIGDRGHFCCEPYDTYTVRSKNEPITQYGMHPPKVDASL